MNLNNIYIRAYNPMIEAIRYTTFNVVHDSVSDHVWNYLNLYLWNLVGDAVKVRAYNLVQHPIWDMYESN
jgi:hypothetical protein